MSEFQRIVLRQDSQQDLLDANPVLGRAEVAVAFATAAPGAPITAIKIGDEQTRYGDLNGLGGNYPRTIQRGTFVYPYEPGEYGNGLVVVERENQLYKLADTVARPFTSSNFAQELADEQWIVGLSQSAPSAKRWLRFASGSDYSVDMVEPGRFLSFHLQGLIRYADAVVADPMRSFSVFDGNTGAVILSPETPEAEVEAGMNLYLAVTEPTNQPFYAEFPVQEVDPTRLKLDQVRVNEEGRLVGRVRGLFSDGEIIRVNVLGQGASRSTVAVGPLTAMAGKPYTFTFAADHYEYDIHSFFSLPLATRPDYVMPVTGLQAQAELTHEDITSRSQIQTGFSAPILAAQVQRALDKGIASLLVRLESTEPSPQTVEIRPVLPDGSLDMQSGISYLYVNRQEGTSLEWNSYTSTSQPLPAGTYALVRGGVIVLTFALDEISYSSPAIVAAFYAANGEAGQDYIEVVYGAQDTAGSYVVLTHDNGELVLLNEQPGSMDDQRTQRVFEAQAAFAGQTVTIRAYNASDEQRLNPSDAVQVVIPGIEAETL